MTKVTNIDEFVELINETEDTEFQIKNTNDEAKKQELEKLDKELEALDKELDEGIEFFRYLTTKYSSIIKLTPISSEITGGR